MVIQQLIIPSNEQYSESFFRGGIANEDRLVLKKGETLSTDTYFNSFSYTVYRDFTSVSGISAEVKFSGNIRLELCLYDGSERVLAEKTSASDSPADISVSVELAGLPDGAFMFFRVYALSDSVIHGGGYNSDAAPQNIECCIVMCTYKREEYALRNAEMLCGYPFSVIRKILIIDNGKTLSVDKFPNDKAEILPNRNYGGSGGFTRGMLEAHRRGYSHVILMDDDISFYPEVFERMTVLLSLLKPEHQNSWVSAAMLSQREPNIQFAMGCYWHYGAVENRGHALDIRNRDNLLSSVQGTANVNYGAWWCLAMPTSVFDEMGYPFPFFIKFDDVEYGIRQNNACDIITVNGIAVTHEDFDSKFSMHLIYYECRNLLVTCAADTDASVTNILSRLFSTAGKQLLLYRYDALKLVIRAFDDFFKGVDFFLNCDEEKLNSEIMNSVPKPVIIQSDTEFPAESCDSRRVSALQLVTLGGHLVPSFFIKKTEADISAMTDDYRKCFGHMVINQHAGRNRCYVMKRSFRKFACSVGSIVRTAFRVVFLYPGIRKEYILRKSEISSESFWENHLGLVRK